MSWKKEKSKGFTLIEMLIFLFIFTLVVLTFYSLFSVGINQIVESRIKLMAVALANEKMEVVHNLDYDDIGTDEGIPAGDILQREVVYKSGRNFYVFTFVQYIDDPYDQTVGNGDLVPNDYKRVRIKASWEDDINSTKAVSLVSNFAPPKKETPIGGGTLSINVLNKDGHGIPQMTVHIVNAVKAVNITAVTDNTGNISFPGAPADGQNYQISVSKEEYYPAQTYPPFPDSDFDPDNEHVAVTEGLSNATTIVTDQSSDFNILTQDLFGTSLSDISFKLEGGKKIGKTMEDPPKTVYLLADNFTSGAQGRKEFPNESYGPYTFIPASSTYQFIGLKDISGEDGEFEIEPNVSLDIKAVFADKNSNSLLVEVTSSGTSLPAPPIEGALVRLKNDSLGYDATVTTDKFGNAYFPVSLPELSLGAYELTVTASGYQDINKTLNIDKFTTDIVSMIAL